MAYFEKWREYTDNQRKMEGDIEQAIESVEGSELDLNKFLLLYFLHQAPGHRLRQNELEDKLHLSASAISRMIARMEARDCETIEKQVCADDKRATNIVLTPIGEKLLAKTLQQIEGVLTKYREILN